METVNSLGNKLSISRISENITNKVQDMSRQRVTYRHGRIWVVLRNEGVKINIRTGQIKGI